MNVTVQNYLRACALQKPMEALIVLAASNTLTQLTAYLAANANQVLVGALPSAAQPILYSKLWIYPFKAMAASGQPTVNANNIWVGKTSKNTPDLIEPSITEPIKYEWPLGQCGDLRDIWISGTATDGVFIQCVCANALPAASS